MSVRPLPQTPWLREDRANFAATSEFSGVVPAAIFTIINMPVMVTMIIIVIIALTTIKPLITDIHRLYDDTPLDFRAFHFGTLEFGNILFRSERENFLSKISLNKKTLNGL